MASEPVVIAPKRLPYDPSQTELDFVTLASLMERLLRPFRRAEFRESKNTLAT
jgi:hypothetical protein